MHLPNIRVCKRPTTINDAIALSTSSPLVDVVTAGLGFPSRIPPRIQPFGVCAIPLGLELPIRFRLWARYAVANRH